MNCNRVGKSGIINKTGTPGSPGLLVDCRSERFYENIEKNILSTVSLLVEQGYFTLSSCEGHIESCPFRCVSVIAEIEIIHGFQRAIHQTHMLDTAIGRIRYCLLNPNPALELYLGEFTHPLIIDISFGDIRDENTQIRQNIFNTYISQNKILPLTEDQLSNSEVLPYLDSPSSHIDVYL